MQGNRGLKIDSPGVKILDLQAPPDLCLLPFIFLEDGHSDTLLYNVHLGILNCVVHHEALAAHGLL